MMKLALRLGSRQGGFLYASEVEFSSETHPGVRFVLRRMSAAGRLTLIERVSALATEYDALRASDAMSDMVRAEALRIRIDGEYLRWGLKSTEGLLIDGERPDAELLFESGPEDLVGEIVERIRRESALSGDEAKN